MFLGVLVLRICKEVFILSRRFYSLSFCDFNPAQTRSTRLADWRAAAIHDSGEHFLTTADTNTEVPHSRCVNPDMRKRNHSEITAPVESDTYPAQGGEKFVAKTLAALEARVAQFPHAGDGSCTVWLAKDVFKLYLKSAGNASQVYEKIKVILNFADESLNGRRFVHVSTNVLSF